MMLDNVVEYYVVVGTHEKGTQQKCIKFSSRRLLSRALSASGTAKRTAPSSSSVVALLVS